MMLPLLLLLSWMMTLSSVGAARYNHDHFLGAVSSSSSWLSSSSRHLPSTTLWGRSNYKTPSSKSNRIVQTKNVVGRYNNNVLLSTMMQLRAGDVADHAVVVAEEQQEKDQEELPHLDQNATFANTTKDVVTNESSSVSTTTTTATTTTTTTTTTPSNDNNPLLFGDPVSVTVQTLLNSPLLDQSVELTMARSRNLASLKKSVSRSLPGRPPESLLYFRYQGRLLQDDQMLIDELMNEKEENDEEDEDDEEKESSGSTLTLQLDMIPPVDPKFAATQLSLQLPQMTTSELLDAYTTNAAAMYRHAQSILRENDVDELVTTASSTSLSVQLQQQARLLRQDLEATFSEKALQLLTPSSSLQQPTEEGGGGGGDETKGEPITDAHTGTIQQRGQRIRVLGGSKANFKSIVQRNLNLNWPDTLRNVCLFLFFGIFGGRSVWSKYLLLLGAPMAVVLQARPVKYLIKQIFYAMVHPPGILLSLLPAPQQAILNFDSATAYEALYPSIAAKARRMKAKAMMSDASKTTITSNLETVVETNQREEDDDDDEDDDDEE